MKRILIFLYGTISYLCFLLAFLYLIGFLSNTAVPKGIDNGLSTPFIPALLINLGLIILWGLPHSLMARKSFKRWWTQWIPAAAERSTYVLVSSLLLLLLLWQWRPMTADVWAVQQPWLRTLIWAVYGIGHGVVLLSSFLINHFELFGLEQSYMQWRNRAAAAPTFKTPLLYRIVRHPLQLGLLIAFWATPDMTVGHLLFAAGMTGYMFIGLYFEERGLVAEFGDTYQEYQRATPKLLPGFARMPKLY